MVMINFNSDGRCLGMGRCSLLSGEILFYSIPSGDQLYCLLNDSLVFRHFLRGQALFAGVIAISCSDGVIGLAHTDLNPPEFPIVWFWLGIVP